MTTIKRGSQARSTYNEDFSYEAELPGGRGSLLVVGDFSPSKYTDLDRLAESQLGQIVESQSHPDVPSSLLLTSLAVEFNNRLLDYKETFRDMSFQCCAAFAAIAEGGLHYLTVGDCRVNVLRGKSLILLSGSGWVDPKGKPLPNVVACGQEMKRGYEEQPDRVLGSTQVSYDPSAAKYFPLEPDDTVLMYSDGVEKVVSPAQLLDILLDQPGDPESVIARILDEVQARQGDDDRTLLVAAGPHPSPASEAHEAAVQSAMTLQREQEERLRKTVEEQQRQAEELRMKSALLEESIAAQRAAAADLKALFKRVETLDKVFSYVAAIDKNTRTIYDVVNSLPRNQSITAAIQNAVGNAPQRDERPLRELKEKVDHISRMLASGAGGPAGADTPQIIRKTDDRQEGGTTPNNQDRNDGGQPHDATRGKGKKGQRAVNLQPAGQASQSAPTEGGLRLVRAASAEMPFREGVIHVRPDRLELIDDTDVPAERLTPSDPPNEAFLFAPEGAPPGWLTAAYLYMRHLDALEDNAGGNGRTPRPPAEAELLEPLDRLPPKLLLRLREWHWHLRERRRTGRASRSVEESIRADEMKVVDSLFSKGGVVQSPELVNLATPEAAGKYVRREGRRGKEFLGTTSGLILVGVVGIILSWALAWLLWGRSVRTGAQAANLNQNAAPASEGNISVEYGADGRTIILTDGEDKLRTNLRLPYLHEAELGPVFSGMRFGDGREAVRKLKESAREARLSLTESAPPSEKYAVYAVREADDKSCSKLLYAINKVELARVSVSMTLAELQSMNPGLRCEDLAVGDKVLGKSGKW